MEIFTIGWMVIEAAIAIGAGIAARSVLLTAFGLDSAIELISGAALLWRLSAEVRSADVGLVEVVERRATWVSAVLLLLLSLYVLTTSIAGLLTRLEPQDSWAGLGISVAAVLLMPLLAWQKQRANDAIQSPALRADVAETLTCAYMAGTTLFGVALSTLMGWWWAQYVAAFALLFFIGWESWEALEAAREAKRR